MKSKWSKYLLICYTCFFACYCTTQTNSNQQGNNPYIDYLKKSGRISTDKLHSILVIPKGSCAYCVSEVEHALENRKLKPGVVAIVIGENPKTIKHLSECINSKNIVIDNTRNILREPSYPGGTAVIDIDEKGNFKITSLIPGNTSAYIDSCFFAQN